MNYRLLLFLLILNLSATAQTNPYQPSEVDSVAEPRGGVALLDTFLQSTLRKPIRAEAEGVGGTVTVSGIVETDGLISSVKILQGLRPDCDWEAIRIFSLFNAWKPAQKNGQPVRQRVTVPIIFQANMPFTYVNGNRIDCYGTDNNFLVDSSQAQYKRIAPIDTNGVPINDVALYKLKAKQWKEYVRQSVIHYKYDDDPDDSKDKVLYYTYIPGYSKKLSGKTFIIDVDRHLFGQVTYQNGQAGPQMIYHRNGSIFERSEYLDTDSQLKIIT